MITIPSTTWMIAAAAAGLTLTAAAAAGLTLTAAAAIVRAIFKDRVHERERTDAKIELQAAKDEAHNASLSGDLNRIHDARLRLQRAISRAVDYGIG